MHAITGARVEPIRDVPRDLGDSHPFLDGEDDDAPRDELAQPLQ
jgi:hypothetical protein